MQELLTKSNWIDILVEDDCGGDSQVENVETLCTDGKWQDLHRVRDNEWRKGDTTHKSEYVAYAIRGYSLIGGEEQEHKRNKAMSSFRSLGDF